MYGGPFADHMEWEYRIVQKEVHLIISLALTANYIGVSHLAGVSNRPMEFKSARKI